MVAQTDYEESAGIWIVPHMWGRKSEAAGHVEGAKDDARGSNLDPAGESSILDILEIDEELLQLNNFDVRILSRLTLFGPSEQRRC